MHPHLRSSIVLCVLSLSAAAAYAGRGPVTYDFVVKPSASGLDGTITFSADNSGTLIGNYDATNNPTGTRTKPGLFGSFGDTENLPVNVSLSEQLGGNVHTAPTGTFTLVADTDLGALLLSGFVADLLGARPIELPATLTLETENFRTRNPTSVYPGNIPITLPIGSVTLAQLAVVQTNLPAVGTLTPTGPNEYSFVVAPLVIVTATLDFFGTELNAPPWPVAFPLAGQIVIAGDAATLTSVQPLDFSNTQTPGLALPQTPLDLPTILPPRQIAHVLLNLTLNTIGTTIAGTNALVADGVAQHPADLNCDSVVNFGDIDSFVLALSDRAAYEAKYPACRWLNGDLDGDGTVGFDDIDPFVALLAGL